MGRSRVDLLEDAESGLVHAFDLLEAALEEVGVGLVADEEEVALVVVVPAESVLLLPQLPVFPVLQQKNDSVLVECHPLNVRVNAHLHHLFPVVQQVPNQQAPPAFHSHHP
jgi:hypothetical protein